MWWLFPKSRKLISFYADSCANVFSVCAWPFYAFFFFFRWAWYSILIIEQLLI